MTMVLRQSTTYGIVKTMKTRQKSARRSSCGFVVGRRGFGMISAVEGIRLTPEMERDLVEFDEKGLSNEERRRAIARKYARVTKS